MDETTEVKTDYLKTHISKVSKLVLLSINCLLMLPQLLANRTLINLGVFLAIYLLLFLIFYKSLEDTPACAYIPLTILADVCCWGGLHFLALKELFDIEGLVENLSYMVEKQICVILLAGGAVASIVGVSKAKLSWLTGIGGLLFSTAFIVSLWGENILSSAFYPLFVLGFAVWSLLIQFITAVIPARRNECIWIGIVLLLVLLAMTGGIRGSGILIQTQWEALARELPYTSLSWWRVAAAAVLSAAASVFLYDLGGEKPSPDCLTAAVTAILILAVRLTCSIYFTWNWTLLPLLMISLYMCSIAAWQGRNLLAFSNGVWMGVQLPILWLVLVQLRDGLWINVIVTTLFTAYFYRQIFHKGSRKPGNLFWLMILICIGAETAGWMFKLRYSLEGLLLVGTIILMAFVASLLLGKPHPAGLQSPMGLRILLCTAAGILCFLTMTQYGTKIHASYDSDVHLITVKMDARGKKNALGDAYYFWRDRYSQQSSEEYAIVETQFQIEPEDEQLVIVARDANGVQTTKHFWFPSWELEK